MAVTRLESPLPLVGGGGSGALGLGRRRPRRSLLELRRGGFVTAEQVATAQREFLLEGMAEACTELGYRQVSVGDVTDRAVSRVAVLRRVRWLDECFLAALYEGNARIIEAARIGSRSEQPWPVAVRAAVTEALALLDARPALAGLCVVQALAGPDGAFEAHHLWSAPGRRPADRRSPPGVRRVVPDLVAEGLVGGAMMMVHVASAADQREHLTGLTGQVMFLLEARSRAWPAPIGALHLPTGSPGARLEQGTLPTAGPARDRADVAGEGQRKQILRYLIEHPGASNTMIARAPGHQPQHHLTAPGAVAHDDLIVSHKHGTRHQWHLTDHGHATLTGPPPAPPQPTAAPRSGNTRATRGRIAAVYSQVRWDGLGPVGGATRLSTYILIP